MTIPDLQLASLIYILDVIEQENDVFLQKLVASTA
jgi:hypothetical protein